MAELDKRPEWFDYDRPEEYDALVTAVKVPLRTGLTLDGDLALPAHDGTVAEGTFPSLVAHYTPYGKGRRREVVEWWARHGYAVVVCDIRGTQASDGVFPGALLHGENEDNYDLIEWLAAQPFSSGRVGQYGQSYGGMASLRVTSLRPPHLVAIAPQQSYSSYYLEQTFPGGIPAGKRTWADGVPAHTGGRLSAEFQKTLWETHPLRDDFWHQVDIDNKYDDITIPVLCYGGWFDTFREGMVSNFLGLEDRANLVVGPWPHGLPEQMPNAPATMGMLLAFFDHHLDGRDTPLPQSKVTSYEVPRSTSRGWVELDGFPPTSARTLELFFDADRVLTEKPGPSATASYEVDPEDGTTAGPEVESGLPDDPNVDHRERDSRRLYFESAPCDADVVVCGRSYLHLVAALSAPEGYFVANLMDVAPDGAVHQASIGYLRATHREGHNHVVGVEPGKMTAYEVLIRAAHWRFATGHRLRISLMSGDYPFLAGDAPNGTVTVAIGDGGSSVELSVLEG